MMQPSPCVVGQSAVVHLYRAQYAETWCGQGGRFGGPVRLLTDGRRVTCARCLAAIAKRGRDLPPAA